MLVASVPRLLTSARDERWRGCAGEPATSYAVVEEMANGGKVDGETLDKAIADTKAEIEKLKKDHPEKAAKLEEMLTKLEAAKAADQECLMLLRVITLTLTRA